MTEQIESIRWKHIQNMNNVVYLDADLIIDNDVYLKGSLTSNIDMSSFITIRRLICIVLVSES